MIVWFLIRDEKRLSGWQSGVISARGARVRLSGFHKMRR